MLVRNIGFFKKTVNDILNTPTKSEKSRLSFIAKDILTKKAKILKLCHKHNTPFYLIDVKNLENNAQLFKDSFVNHLNTFSPYYAFKSNNHPEIIKRLIGCGFGIDVSSGMELKTALGLGASRIIFTGPGKSLSEIEMAVSNFDRVIINMDSFREMEKIESVATKLGQTVRVGVRIYTKFHGPWTKFGIPLEQLAVFWKKAGRFRHIKLSGIQVHMSWNRTVEPYKNVLCELSSFLRKKFNCSMLESVEYIDFGGGFMPAQTFGYYPWKSAAGAIVKIVADAAGVQPDFVEKYYTSKGLPIEEFAKKISSVINEFIRPVVNCTFYAEPGRIICHNAMHIVLKVADVKRRDCIILDGGINIIGWERFENEYFPVVNLTHPANNEKKYKLYGNLCTPRDTWGEYCYASRIKEDDILVVANQGAYTFSMAQNFIKPIPPVYILE